MRKPDIIKSLRKVMRRKVLEAGRPINVRQASKITPLVYDAFLEVLLTALHEGEDIRLKGIGKFWLKFINVHDQKNNLTGEHIEVPSKVKLKFIPCETIEETLSEKLGNSFESSDLEEMFMNVLE